MPTKVDTETGWAKERPIENGIYCYRCVGILPEILLVLNGFVFDFGDSVATSLSRYKAGEWMGPFTVSDFEQLIQLRRAARSVLQMYGDAPMPRGVAALREALAPTEEK